MDLALKWSCWVGPGEEDLGSARGMAGWLERMMREACEVLRAFRGISVIDDEEDGYDSENENETK